MGIEWGDLGGGLGNGNGLGEINGGDIVCIEVLKDGGGGGLYG